MPLDSKLQAKPDFLSNSFLRYWGFFGGLFGSQKRELPKIIWIELVMARVCLRILCQSPKVVYFQEYLHIIWFDSPLHWQMIVNMRVRVKYYCPGINCKSLNFQPQCFPRISYVGRYLDAVRLNALRNGIYVMIVNMRMTD